jgi:DNA-directed RNA polymerase specialized sigma24 family protein
MVMNPDLTDSASQRALSSAAADLMTRAPGTVTIRRGTRWQSGTPRLIWPICRRHGLGGAGTQDVGQSVWLKLADQLQTNRVPAAPPGSPATNTCRECDRIRRAARGARDTGHVHGAETNPNDHTQTTEQEGLLAAERHAAPREALTHLPSGCQQLTALLIDYPPPSNAQISVRLSIPGRQHRPSRGGCPEELRSHLGMTALINPDAGTAA